MSSTKAPDGKLAMPSMKFGENQISHPTTSAPASAKACTTPTMRLAVKKAEKYQKLRAMPRPVV